MDVQDLRSFEALAEELSFTAAARRLHVSHSSLSKRLERLERSLGVTLLDRAPSSVSLTPAGAWLVSRVTSLLREWQDITDQVRRLEVDGPAGSPPGGRPLLRLAVHSTGREPLQEFLAAELPTHQVAVLRMYPAEALRRLGTGDGVDAALIYAPPEEPIGPAAPGADVATVVVEPVWVLLSARHRLAEREELTVEEVVEHGLPWMVSSPEDPLRRWEEALLLGRAPEAQLREGVAVTPVDIVRGQGVTLGSPLHTPNELLAARRLTPAATLHQHLTWQPHRLPGEVAAELLTAVRRFHRHCAQRNPLYWRWIQDHPSDFPGIIPDPKRQSVAVAAAVRSSSLETLSPREREVLTLVAAGFNDSEIGQELQLSPLTARAHVAHIRAKLGARDRVQLVVLAYRHGLTA